MNYADFEYWLCAVLLVLSMVGMGATLTAREFLQIAKAPRPVLLVLAAQIVFAPLLALLLARVLFLQPGIAMGLLVVSSLPGGTFSNLLTYLGRGNVALSISSTAFCTLMSLVTTALVLKLFAGHRLPNQFEMPVGRIVSEVGAFLLLPLLAGMTLRRFGPRWSVPVSRRAVQASLVLLGVFVVAALGSGRVKPFSYGLRAPVALFLYFTGSLWLGYGLALWQRYSMHDGFAMAIEVSVRNTGLGLLLNASLFPADSEVGAGDALGAGVVYVLLAYSAVSLGMSLLEVYVKRNRIGVLYRPR
ncbi:MAG: bile acid:sodium symporter family protein [Planctomycetales bacterium]|nr:bile acid:sodium symporter family protein [Planctomycetales bacterium]